MKTKITLEVDIQQTTVVLKNSEGHTFEFNPNTKIGEELFDFIVTSKMKHFSMQGALKFWDNFDVELYARILKARNNE